jgi:hypothetical protein
MAVVQRMNRPGQYADQVHNPILFRKIVQITKNKEYEPMAKWCHH